MCLKIVHLNETYHFVGFAVNVNLFVLENDPLDFTCAEGILGYTLEGDLDGIKGAAQLRCARTIKVIQILDTQFAKSRLSENIYWF